MRRRVFGVINLRPFFRVERAAVVTNSDYDLRAFDDDSHVDEMFLAVVEAVLNNVARHLFDTNAREHAAPPVDTASLTKILRVRGKPQDLRFVRDGYVELLIAGNVEVLRQEQIIFKAESYSSAVPARDEKYRQQKRGVTQREGQPQSVYSEVRHEEQSNRHDESEVARDRQAAHEFESSASLIIILENYSDRAQRQKCYRQPESFEHRQISCCVCAARVKLRDYRCRQKHSRRHCQGNCQRKFQREFHQPQH